MISDFLHNKDYDMEVIDFDKFQKLPSESPIYEFYVARLWHKKVFIKRLRQEYQDNPFYLSALKKEFEIGISLNHPSIPVYRDYKNGTLIIDYIDGDTLSNLLKNGNLSGNSGEINKIISQLIEVTDYLHQNNITHCDIKTDNIIISKGTGNLILIDFDKCHTDAYDNTRANPENFGIEKCVRASSELDFYQISLIVKELISLLSNSDRKRYNVLITALQKNKVDTEELGKILNKKFFINKFFINILRIIILLLILLLLGLVIVKTTQFKEPYNAEDESNSPVENEVLDSVTESYLNGEKEVSSETGLKEVEIPFEVIDTPTDSVNEQIKNISNVGSLDLSNHVMDNETVNDNPYSLARDVTQFPEKGTETVETLINRRMNELLKPYAEYLKKYEKAVENPDISYEEMTSIANGSTDVLVKTMDEACKTLYKEFPDINKVEIQKIAWISPPYLDLVNWGIEISERYAKRVMKNINQ